MIGPAPASAALALALGACALSSDEPRAAAERVPAERASGVAPRPSAEVSPVAPSTAADGARGGTTGASAASAPATSAPPAARIGSARAAAAPDLAPVIAKLDETPYVEETCEPAAFDGWPFPAKACTYHQKRETLHVVVADPEPSRVAAWIADAVRQMPRVAGLERTAPEQYGAALVAMAEFVMGQSSRAYPLSGEIWEDMANDGIGKRYPFDRGVSVRSGRCRLVSITSDDWCAYAATLPSRDEPEEACRERLADPGAFAALCLELHRRAWNATSNDAFRAFAWGANARLERALAAKPAGDEAVVPALRRVLGLGAAPR